MKITGISKIRIALFSGVAAVALLAGPQFVSSIAGGHADGQAYAQGQGQGQGSGHGQGGSGGGHGQGGSGAGGGSMTPGGQGGPSAESDAKGPMFKGGDNENKPGAGTQGGKPTWAQEGIPEVELGRLNVVRSPEHVLDQAFAEALSNFDPALSAALYSMSAEEFATFIKANWDTITLIDSPLENLGLYKDVVSDGATQLPQVTPASTDDLAAIFLGVASDKTVPVTEDTVIAVTKILGLTLTDAQVTDIAEKAEIVRQAVAEAHG